MAEEFSLNNRVLVEVDTTPASGSPTYVRIAKGITSAVDSHNDSTDDTAYLDGGGYGNSDVIGKQYTLAVSGHRVIGNTAQDYIVGLQGEFGDDAKTNVRYTRANGHRTTAKVSATEIVDAGGDANSKTEFSVNFKGCGAPTIAQPTSAPDLSATVTTGSVIGATKFSASVDPQTNTLAYKLSSAAKTANLYAHSVGLIAYTTNADIPAAVDQYLNMYELDANGRIAKFASHKLVLADIKSGA